MSQIVENTKVAPAVNKLVIKSPDIARKAQPGQFAILIHDEDGERIPITIADWDRENGTITLYIMRAGFSTGKMCDMKTGESLFALAGPFGLPATIENYGTVYVGGGCHGIGAIYPLARALKEKGNHVVVAIEARENDLLFLEEDLKAVCSEFVPTTSDGSSGTEGKVQDNFTKLVSEGRKFDRAYFTGCTFMMMVTTYAAMQANVPCFCELNALMVDGIGMCGCCRVTVDGQTKFACVDGPEFEGEKVDWIELLQRNAVYHDQEQEASKTHGCRIVKKMQEGGQ